jgi:hypothetical protein
LKNSDKDSKNREYLRHIEREWEKGRGGGGEGEMGRMGDRENGSRNIYFVSLIKFDYL